MLLKMRGVPPKTTYRPDTGILAAAETQKDEAANKWFEALSLPCEFPFFHFHLHLPQEGHC